MSAARAAAAPPPPPPRPAGSRYGWFVGVVVVLIIAYITVNTALTVPNGSHGIEPGRPLPPFAVPLALSGLTGDANVATRVNQGLAGRRPACSVTGADIVNICAIERRGPVALALFVPTGICPKVADELAALQAAFPAVQMVGVAIRGNRADVRTLVRRSGWRFPVGYDRDGALATLYHLPSCALISFADRGGRAHGPALLATPPPSEQVRQRLSELTTAGPA